MHPQYGTLGDFSLFLREAHKRGLRVITELVLNHTSDQHKWFQRSRRAAPGSAWRNFYVWSDTPDQYKDARIIFKDVETSNWTWDEVAGAYYWHRFFSHQPDLNYENPEVHKAMTKVLDFWLDLGVDGLRLDAVPYLYEQEGTNCENLPHTHEFLKKLRAHVDEKYQDRMLLAEANQWPEDAVTYFGQGRGDECHMAFHFPLMPRLFMAVRMEDRTPIVDILEQTPPIPETSQWALFLRNHDELTLEMVTDEERDYMYRMYAHVQQARLNLGIRRRLAPLLGNDRKRIELLNGLLLSLPGTPVLYYGDEIGMGDNIYLGDRNGVRTPMQWSADRNAGFSRANPQRLYLPITLDPEYHYEAINVEAQLRNPHSLLWWMRRVLALRKNWRALGEGHVQFLAPQNRKVLAYILRFEQEVLLVLANLSRFPQPVELDLSEFKGRTPFELFGRTPFPAIGELPFFLTPGPHGFYWFSLEVPVPTAAETVQRVPGRVPELSVEEHWEELLSPRLLPGLERAFTEHVKAVDWFAGATKAIKGATLQDALPLGQSTVHSPQSTAESPPVLRSSTCGGWTVHRIESGVGGPWTGDRGPWTGPHPLAGGFCRCRSGVVHRATRLRDGCGGHPLAQRGTSAPRRRGQGLSIRPARRALRCPRDTAVRLSAVGCDYPATAAQRTPGQCRLLARPAAARAFPRSRRQSQGRAPESAAAPYFDPVRRAVRPQALSPPPLGHQPGPRGWPFPDRAFLPLFSRPGRGARIPPG